jgi:hypothetical protein
LQTRFGILFSGILSSVIAILILASALRRYSSKVKRHCYLRIIIIVFTKIIFHIFYKSKKSNFAGTMELIPEIESANAKKVAHQGTKLMFKVFKEDFEISFAVWSSVTEEGSTKGKFSFMKHADSIEVFLNSKS